MEENNKWQPQEPACVDFEPMTGKLVLTFVGSHRLAVGERAGHRELWAALREQLLADPAIAAYFERPHFTGSAEDPRPTTVRGRAAYGAAQMFLRAVPRGEPIGAILAELTERVGDLLTRIAQSTAMTSVAVGIESAARQDNHLPALKLLESAKKAGERGE